MKPELGIEQFVKSETANMEPDEEYTEPTNEFKRKLNNFRKRLDGFKGKETTEKTNECRQIYSKEELDINEVRNLKNTGVFESYTDTSNYDYNKIFKVLVVGTSITDQALNMKAINESSNIKVKKIKAFTITNDGEVDPGKNVEDMLKKEMWNDVYDLCIIEVGANEVTDISRKKGCNMETEIELKTKKLIKLIESVYEMTGGEMKIVVLKQLKRMDSLLRVKLAKKMDEYLEAEAKCDVKV